MDIYTVLQIVIGFIGLIIIAMPFSDNYKIINYKYVTYGVLSQIILAAILLKVPFIIKKPQPQNPGLTNDNLVSTGLDLIPTLCDFANVPVPDGLSGKSLSPFLLNEHTGNWRSQLVIQSQFASQGYGINGRALIKDQYKYVVYSYGQNREQVFDLKKDPYEQVNLAKESRHSEILNNHRQTLYQWLLINKDFFCEHYSHPGQPILPNIPFLPNQQS